MLRRAAIRDVDGAREAYEQRRSGLGDQFAQSLDEILASIGKNAELYQIVESQRQVRRAMLMRFPYAVYYIIEAERERVVVLAVLHAARHSARWRSRE